MLRNNLQRKLLGSIDAKTRPVFHSIPTTLRRELPTTISPPCLWRAAVRWLWITPSVLCPHFLVIVVIAKLLNERDKKDTLDEDI